MNQLLVLAPDHTSRRTGSLHLHGSSPMSLPAQTMAVSTEKRSTKEKEAIQAVLPLAELILEPGPPGAERVRSIFVW